MSHTIQFTDQSGQPKQYTMLTYTPTYKNPTMTEAQKDQFIRNENNRRAICGDPLLCRGPWHVNVAVKNHAAGGAFIEFVEPCGLVQFGAITPYEATKALAQPYHTTMMSETPSYGEQQAMVELLDQANWSVSIVLERLGHKSTATTYKVVGGTLYSILETWAVITGRRDRRKRWWKVYDSHNHYHWQWAWQNVDWHISM